MKLLLFVLFIFLSSLPAYSQEKDENRLGVASSVYFYEKSYKGFITPYVEIRRKSMALTMGATILVTSEFDASDRKYPKLTGFEGSYKFYPTITNCKVDFHLHATLLFQRIVDRWEVNYWNNNYSFYENAAYKNVEKIVNPSLGYGISFNISKRLRVNQSIGAGYFFSTVNGEGLNKETSETDHHDYRPYGNGGFAFHVNLGMSYSIGK